MKYITIFLLIFISTSAFSQKRNQGRSQVKTKSQTEVKVEEKQAIKNEENINLFNQFIEQFEAARLPYQINEHTFHYTNIKPRKVLKREYASFLPELANIRKDANGNNSKTIYADKLVHRSKNQFILIYAIQPQTAKVPSEYYLAIFKKEEKTETFKLSDKLLLAKYHNKKSVLTAQIGADLNIKMATVGFDYKKEKGTLNKLDRYQIDYSFYSIENGKLDLIEHKKTPNKYYQPLKKSATSTPNTLVDG